MWSTPAEAHDLSDEEHFTAEHLLHYYLGSRGVEVADIGVSDVVIGTFLRPTWNRLVEQAHAKPAQHWVYSHEERPLYHGTVGGRPLSLLWLPLGAPAAVLMMEMLIAAGARSFIVLGAAGSLQENVPVGSLVVPEAAVREDGTSFHYLPPDVVPRPSAALAERLREGCRGLGVEPFGGVNWSTDAIFRELKKKVLYHQAQGVVTVEMEAAAMFAAGMFRGVDVAFLLTVSDELFRPWAPAFREPAYRERLKLAQDVALRVAAELPLRGGSRQ